MPVPEINPGRLIVLVVSTVCILALTNLLSSDVKLVEPVENSTLSSSSFENKSAIKFDSTELNYRLPLNILPTKYYLKIHPVIPPLTGVDLVNYNFTRFTAPGEVTISFDCVESTNKIVLHQYNIFIYEDSVTVTNEQNETEIPVIGQEKEVKKDFYIILLGEILQPGKYRLFIKFKSIVSKDNAVGIFANTYIDPVTLKLRWMTATKFQPTNAREAFPCFDEPAFKAVFVIIIGRTAGYHSLSNAPLNETIEDPELEGLFWDYFKPSLIMSPYLVCFAISDFKSQEPSLANGKPIKVWAPEHIIKKDGGRYASDLTAKLVSYFENFFNMTDPAEKIDSIMIPPFTTTAMENWGLITYTEHMLIYIPTENSEYRRGLVTIIVAHELSHNWYGNLVTCDWWDDVWLNEGFATYLSFLAVKELHPEFDSDTEFINDIVQLSMKTDPNPTTRPMKSVVQTQTEIDGSFSRTTYRKGASIIRMMQFFLGPNNLKEGMRRFLRKFAYKTATQDDLFHEFNLISQNLLPKGVSVKTIMDSWTLRAGFPLLRVSIVNPHKIKLSQEAISWRPLDHQVSPSSFWWIPITISTEQNQNMSEIRPHIWIPENTTSITYSKGIDTTKWIIINPNYSAYTCVLYDVPLTLLIQQQLEKDHTVFSAITRSQIIFDYVQFWNARYISMESVLQMTTYISKETEFVVWNTLFQFFNELHRRLFTSKTHYDLFIKYLVPRVESVLLSPGIGLEAIPNEKPIILFFRTELISLACQLDSPICLNYSMGLLNKWIQSPHSNPIPDVTEEIIICAMMKAGGETAWTFIYQKCLNEFSSYKRWLLLKGLTCATSEDLIYRTLDLMSNTSIHNLQFNSKSNVITGMLGFSSNKYAVDIIFNYILENYELNSTFINSDVLSTTLGRISYYFYKEEDINTLKDFLEANQEMNYLSYIVSTMEENQIWINIHGSFLSHWLLSHT